MQSPQPSDDPRVYLAAERTFLAWIRTGIALMGFGFILARFGVFLRQIQLLRGSAQPQSSAASVWFGVALVVIGVVVNVAATARHVKLVRALRTGQPDFHWPSKLAVTIAIVLACIGLATAIYLVLVSMSIPLPQ